MRNEKLVLRDSEGNIFNRLARPSVVFDKDLGTLLKVGEYEVMLDYYNETVKLYNSSGLNHVSKDLALMEIPREQEELDKVFQISGYVGVLYKKVLNDKE